VPCAVGDAGRSRGSKSALVDDVDWKTVAKQLRRDGQALRERCKLLCKNGKHLLPEEDDHGPLPPPPPLPPQEEGEAVGGVRRVPGMGLEGVPGGVRIIEASASAQGGTPQGEAGAAAAGSSAAASVTVANSLADVSLARLPGGIVLPPPPHPGGTPSPLPDLPSERPAHKAGAGGRRQVQPARKWSEQEDEKLCELVAERGSSNHVWVSVSKDMPGRDRKVCLKGGEARGGGGAEGNRGGGRRRIEESGAAVISRERGMFLKPALFNRAWSCLDVCARASVCVCDRGFVSACVRACVRACCSFIRVGGKQQSDPPPRRAELYAALQKAQAKGTRRGTGGKGLGKAARAPRRRSAG
jgi:hypothetical protein